MHIAFMLGCGNTNAFLFWDSYRRNIQQKKKNLYYAFVDLELAFDRVPRDALWALKKLGVEEWLDKTVQSMYRKARSYVRINGPFSDDFLVQVELHQNSVLSPLLLIIVLAALSKETRSGYSEELL